jgi:hypothetical protein
LSSETNPKNPVDLFCIEIDSRSLEKFRSSDVVAFSEPNCPTFYLNNSNNSFHAPTVGFEARDFIYKHGKSTFYVGMKNLKCSGYSQIDYAVLELRQTLKQELELLLNRGRLIYTKSGVFDVSYSSSFQFGNQVLKLASAAKPRGSNQIHFHNIEHPVVIDGQRSPSSSEDG